MDDTSPKTYRLTQFSLLNLVLLTTIIALGLTVYLQYRELSPLRAELRSLREETGQLVVDDPTKLQAIRIETYNAWAWKWRLWIPAGKTYRLRWKTWDIPKNGKFPDTGFAKIAASPEGRELVLTARIERTPSDTLRLAISHSFFTSYGTIRAQNSDWLLKGSRGSSGEGVGKTTQVAQDGKPFVLIRKRVYYKSPTDSIPPTPEPETTDGILIWLEEWQQ